jgi:hypothetical protein
VQWRFNVRARFDPVSAVGLPRAGANVLGMEPRKQLAPD